VWFTEAGKNGSKVDYVGYMTKAGAFREFSVSNASGHVGDIVAGGHNEIFFRQAKNLIGMHASGAIFATQNLGFLALNDSLVQTKDHNIWYSEAVNHEIGVAKVASL
jgi:hypothetical protein